MSGNVELRLDAYLAVEHLSQLGRAITSMRTQTIARFGNSLTMRTRSALHERGVAHQLQAWKIDQEVHGRSITDDRVRELFRCFWEGELASSRIGTGRYRTADEARAAILADCLVLYFSLLLHAFQTAQRRAAARGFQARLSPAGHFD